MSTSPDQPNAPADLPPATAAMMRRARANPLKELPPEDPPEPEGED